MNTMKWLLKREYWEHKGGFLWAPVVVASLIALLTIGSMLYAVAAGNSHGFHINGDQTMSLNGALAGLSGSDKAEFAAKLAAGYPAFAMPLMITLGFVVFFYCLGNLYDERKDRSILFWKSLPISDSNTVISKAAMALLVGPLIALIMAFILSFLILFTLLTLAAFNGLNLFGEVLGNGDFYKVIFNMLSFVPIYVLWALPTVGYLMFVSAWAKSKPFLWAVGVPVIGGVILSWLSMLTGSDIELDKYWQLVGRGLTSVFPGSWIPYYADQMQTGVNGQNVIGVLMSNTYGLLTTANLWIGVAVGLALLYASIKMRRYRDEG
jgi:ABC-2 type transport system permease protein